MPARFDVLAVGFDLDGTLLDSAADLAGSVDLALEAEALPPLGLERIRPFIGRGLGNLIAQAVAVSAGPGSDATLLDRVMAAFERFYARDLAVHTRPYEGARQTLVALRARGFSLACITNKSERYTLPLLEATGLGADFDVVVSGDTVGAKKPDPRPVLHACERLGVSPARFLFVGDSTHDLKAARAAGCPAVAVTYGYPDDLPALVSGADAVVGRLEECLGLLAWREASGTGRVVW